MLKRQSLLLIRASKKHLEKRIVVHPNPLKLQGSETEGEGSTQVLTKPDQKLAKPPFYKVLILNDDYTPMDFVVHVLKKFFSKSDGEASKIMYQVHNEGAGLAGVYSYEIAETKVMLTNQYAQKNDHPLKCTLEKESDS